MFKKIDNDPNKRPRLLGELGDLAHARVSSSEFTYSGGEAARSGRATGPIGGSTKSGKAG